MTAAMNYAIDLRFTIQFAVACSVGLFACQPATDTVSPPAEQAPTQEVTSIVKKIPVLFDTDANNELDDQHAMAYLFFNGDVFDVVGVTVNATFNGGEIGGHYDEAERIIQLCGVEGSVPLLKGANGSFDEIRGAETNETYDGQAGVDFIIEQAHRDRDQKLVLLPVGKLTNIALALERAPDIKDKVRIVWLGSNYPEPGEYNQINDIPALNYILEQEVPFEMVMVRYGKPSGSDIVRATPGDIAEIMPATGPRSAQPIQGRHGDTFSTFGDYSVSLFSHAVMHGDPPSRALFDMVAVAILKDPTWGEATELPAPTLVEGNWEDQPQNTRKIILWENFSADAIMADFYDRMVNFQLAE